MKDEIIVAGKPELQNLIETSLRKVLSEQSRAPQKVEDEIFNVKQAAKFLNLAPQTLYGFTSKKTIPFLKRGKKLYFRKSDLEQWLSEGKQKTNEEISKELKENHKSKRKTNE